MQVGKQEFAWTCMIARSNENKGCMRVDESWPEKNVQKLRPFCWACCYKGYVLYVALHEVYNFYIRASIEVYIKYLESDPDPILS